MIFFKPVFGNKDCFVIFTAVFFLMFGKLAVAKEINNAKNYNYNAVCLFIDFAIGIQFHEINSPTFLNKKYVKKISKKTYIKNIDHAEKDISVYAYKTSMASATLIKNSNGIFIEEAIIKGGIIPKSMRHKNYLLPILQIKEGIENTTIGCDNNFMQLTFKNEILDFIKINSSTD